MSPCSGCLAAVYLASHSGDVNVFANPPEISNGATALGALSRFVESFFLRVSSRRPNENLPVWPENKDLTLGNLPHTNSTPLEAEVTPTSSYPFHHFA